MRVGLSIDGGAADRGSRRRRAWEVFAVLSLWVFGGGAWRQRESDRWDSVQVMRLHAGGLRGARDVGAVRRARVCSGRDPGEDVRRQELPQLRGCGESDPIQRFGPAGLWDGMVSAAGGARAQ